MCPKPVPPTTVNRVVSPRKSAPARPKQPAKSTPAQGNSAQNKPAQGKPAQSKPAQPRVAPARGRRPSLPSRPLPRATASSGVEETTGSPAPKAPARQPQRRGGQRPAVRQSSFPREDSHTESSWDDVSDSADVAELGKERRKRGAASALWSVLTIGLVVALCAGLAWLVGFSQVLAVKNVRVTGADRVGQQAVQQQVAQATGTPLARLDLNKYRDAVSALPGVEAVEVSRSWPTTMTVEVTEFQLVGQITDGDETKSLAPDGSVFVIPGVEPSGPMVKLDVEPGAVETVRAAVAKTLSTLPAEMTDRVVSATAKSSDSVEFTLTSGATVLWGDDSEPFLKTRVLELLLREPSSRYDVSAPTVPVRSGKTEPTAKPSTDDNKSAPTKPAAATKKSSKAKPTPSKPAVGTSKKPTSRKTTAAKASRTAQR